MPPRQIGLTRTAADGASNRCRLKAELWPIGSAMVDGQGAYSEIMRERLLVKHCPCTHLSEVDILGMEGCP